MQSVVFIVLGVLVISLVGGGIFVRDVLTKQQATIDHVATTVAEAVVAGIRGTLGYDQPLVVPADQERSLDEPIQPEVPDIELDELFIPGSTEEFAMNQAGWMNAGTEGQGWPAGRAGDRDVGPPPPHGSDATGETS